MESSEAENKVFIVSDPSFSLIARAKHLIQAIFVYQYNQIN